MAPAESASSTKRFTAASTSALGGKTYRGSPKVDSIRSTSQGMTSAGSAERVGSVQKSPV